MRVIVTGSRDWPDEFLVWSTLDYVWATCGDDRLVVVHGGATGADSHASSWVRFQSDAVTEEPHPVTDADWKRIGKGAGPQRNQAMVDRGADLVLAFPMGKSFGTRGCMRMAKAAGIPITVIECAPSK